MKYMSGSTLLPTLTAPRGYPVILMQQSMAITNSLMAGVLYQTSDVSSGIENSSGCDTPPPVLDSRCNTPPPILERYGTEDVIKQESPDPEQDLDTIAFLPLEVGSCEAVIESEPKLVTNPSLKAQSSSTSRTSPPSNEVRRSQRKALHSNRDDGSANDREAHLNETIANVASTSSEPPTKKRKIQDVASIREGFDYQADVDPIESWEQPSDSNRLNEVDRDVCVWKDDHGAIPAKELEEFWQVTRNQFAFNVADALEVVYRNNYDMKTAMERVEELEPQREEPFTAQEQRLFLKSISVHGKNFFRMHKMIPSRSVPSLINHYYSTKKARCFGVVTDVPCPQLLRLCDEEPSAVSRSECDTCAQCTVRPQKRRKGRLCAMCDLYMRRFKRARPFTVPLKQSTDVDIEPVDCIPSSSASQGCKGQLPISVHKCSFLTPRLASIRNDTTAQWTVAEELEALKGFRTFGKNFKAIAESIQTKSLEMVRRFYEDKQQQFRIEFLINAHSKRVKSEERTSEGESTNASRMTTRDNGHASRRSQRNTYSTEPMSTRMTTRHLNGNASSTALCSQSSITAQHSVY